MEKEFGSISKQHIIDFYKIFCDFINELAEEFDSIDSIKLDDQFSLTWHQLYELELSQITQYLLKIMNLEDEIQRAATSEDPNGHFINLFASDFEPDVDFKDLQPTQLAATLSCIYCLIRNFECFAGYQVSINQLLKEAGQGSDESLFKAINIDTSVACTVTASKRISRALITDDGEFFEHLSRAVKGSYSKKPANKYAALNFFIYLIQSTPGSVLDEEALHDLFTLDLPLYPDVNRYKDSPGSLKKQLERTRHRVKDIKS